MKPVKRFLRNAALVPAVLLLGLAGACSTSGTPSVAAPPVTVTATATATTSIRTTATVTETVTQTPTTTSAAPVLVAATFQDPANYECADATVDWCWALDVTTTGPCPNGAFISLNVYKNEEDAVLTVLETTSAPVTDALGGKVTVQLSATGVSAEGDTLQAALKEARCA